MKLLCLLALSASAYLAVGRPVCTCTLLTTRPAVNYGRVALLREFHRHDGSLQFSEQVEAFSWGEDVIRTSSHVRQLVGYFPSQEMAASRCENLRAFEQRAGRCQ